MEFRHLRCFIILAEELHFTRAAQRLHIAQPHLSQEIRRLERDVGAALFRRNKRNVALTDAGRAFLVKAVEIVRATEDAKRIAQRTAAGATGRLVVGFAGSAGYELLPAAVRAFRSQWPDVELELRELATSRQLDLLRKKQLHVGLLRKLIAEDSLISSRIVKREALIVALPKDHPLATRKSIPISALSQEPWIVFDRTPAPGMFGDLMAACEEAGFAPIIAQEAGEIPTMINLVSSGLGIAMLPESVTVLRRSGVVYRSLTGTTQVSHLVVAWVPDETNVPLRNFLNVIGA